MTNLLIAIIGLGLVATALIGVVWSFGSFAIWLFGL